MEKEQTQNVFDLSVTTSAENKETILSVVFNIQLKMARQVTSQ